MSGRRYKQNLDEAKRYHKNLIEQSSESTKSTLIEILFNRSTALLWIGVSIILVAMLYMLTF